MPARDPELEKSLIDRGRILHDQVVKQLQQEGHKVLKDSNDNLFGLNLRNCFSKTIDGTGINGGIVLEEKGGAGYGYLVDYSDRLRLRLYDSETGKYRSYPEPKGGFNPDRVCKLLLEAVDRARQERQREEDASRRHEKAAATAASINKIFGLGKYGGMLRAEVVDGHRLSVCIPAGLTEEQAEAILRAAVAAGLGPSKYG